MYSKILSVFAAVALLAACETAPDQGATNTGSGQVPAATTAPSGPVAGSKEDFVVSVGDTVFFAFDKSDLSAEARSTLEKQAFWLRKYQNYSITIEGHADERGTREYNLALGERRAQAVKDYLAVLGVNAGRISTLSWGEERPRALGSDEEAWAQNRRAQTVLN